MNTKKVGVAEVVVGMALVLAGKKKQGLLLFGHGFYGLEKAYRYNHPRLEPGLKARWNEAVRFYDETHQEDTNRFLHRWGIPVILLGAVGLLTARPYGTLWRVFASTFALGWLSNIVGHGKYEKNAPAFTEDPLSFIAGPVWDLKQLKSASSTVPAQGNLDRDE